MKRGCVAASITALAANEYKESMSKIYPNNFQTVRIDSMKSESRFYRNKNKFIFWNKDESEYVTFKEYADIKTTLSLYWQKELMLFDEKKFAPWIDEKIMMGFL